MPVYTSRYAPLSKPLKKPRHQWLIMAEYEVRLLWRFLLFKILVLIAVLNSAYYALQIMVYHVVAQDEAHPLHQFLVQFGITGVDARFFYLYLERQAAALLFIMLYAGAGMISNDARNNLMPIYFSRPLSWRSYLAGKVGALLALGMIFSVIPCLFLMALHHLMIADMELLRAGWWWPLAVVGFSFLGVLVIGSAVLACSAVFNSQGYAALASLSLYLGLRLIAESLVELTGQGNIRIIDISRSLDRVGRHWFNMENLPYPASENWAFLFLFGVISVSFLLAGLITRRHERVE